MKGKNTREFLPNLIMTTNPTMKMMFMMENAMKIPRVTPLKFQQELIITWFPLQKSYFNNHNPLGVIPFDFMSITELSVTNIVHKTANPLSNNCMMMKIHFHRWNHSPFQSFHSIWKFLVSLFVFILTEFEIWCWTWMRATETL